MTQVQTAQATVTAPLVLTPPEPVLPVVEQVAGAVSLDPEIKKRADEQVEAFVAALTQENLGSDAFRSKLDSAFALGRKEIADATTLSNSFTRKNFVGETDSAAFKAISEMRQLFDELNPARQGDLFESAKVMGIPVPTKLLGVRMPFGNKLANYLRRFESADGQLNALYQHIADAKLEIQTGVAELDGVRQKLWDALGKLEGVAYFMDRLDARVAQEVAALKVTDAARSRALEQEVLYYVRQNSGDVKATQALTINAYNVFGEMRKTGRELINGCDRTMTLGMAALSVAVTMARATGVQIRVMKMLTESKSSIEGLILATGEGLNRHVDAVTQYANDPVLGVQTLQRAFELTFSAMTTMETFRTNALGVQAANNETLSKLVLEHTARIKEERRAAQVGVVLDNQG
jgi:uncharacterized protein YaaN involved in tellurite resistance